jgi:hypothetical protein
MQVETLSSENICNAYESHIRQMDDLSDRALPKLRRDSRSSHLKISSVNSGQNVTGYFLSLLHKFFHR